MVRTARQAVFAAFLVGLAHQPCLAVDNGPASFNTSPSQLADGTPACGDPFLIGSGDLFEQIVDYQTPGPNSLIFARIYNSMTVPGAHAAEFGANWRSSYDRYLNVMWAGGRAFAVTAERQNGELIQFMRSGEGWASDGDLAFELRQVGEDWELADRHDNVETYARGGKGPALLTSIRGRNGYQQKLQYDAENHLVSVTDSFGRALQFTYENGKLRSITTPDGLVLRYSYGTSRTTSGAAKPADLLTSVTYSTEPQTSQSYLYEDPNLPLALTGVIDENGARYASWTYDWRGRVTSSQLAGGADRTDIAYNVADRSRTVTDRLGVQEVFKFATVHRMAKVIEISRLATATTPAATRKFSYDANGYLVSETDWNGNRTTYVNDARGLPTSITLAAGTPQARATTIEWDAKYHLPVRLVVPGLTTGFAYDDSGNLLARTKTDTTTGATPYATNGATRTWRFTWSNGLIASVRGPRTDVDQLTTFAYDASGALTALTNALGQTTRLTAHTPGGLPLAIVDPNGATAKFTYDARSRLRSATVVTAAGELTIATTFDAAGNVIGISRPDGVKIVNSYDDAHRLTRVADRFDERVDLSLDAIGDSDQTTISGAAGAAGSSHADLYDALGRALRDAGGAGQTTSIGYDANGQATEVTDPLGRVTKRSFNALNLAEMYVDAAGGVTAIAFDAQSRPASVTDPNGHVTRYTYDGFGDVIQKVSPDTGTTVYRYDLAGNVVQTVDAAGAVTINAFDALNRLTATTYPADPSENVALTYDQGEFGLARLTAVKDAVGLLERAYDERGDVRRETRKRAAATLVTTYAYDSERRIAAIAYPSGWTIDYARDGAGRINAIAAVKPGSSPGVKVVSDIVYEPFGPVKALVYGNGATELREFDRDYRATRVAVSGKRTILDLAYSYDPVGNVTSVTDAAVPANSQSFSYDGLDRLTRAKGGYGAFAYAYDAVGNRLTATAGEADDASYAYAPDSNRLLAIKDGRSTQRLAYTPNGSIAGIDRGNGGVTELAYDNAGRLAKVAVDGKPVAAYLYDAFGRRAVKSHPGSVSAETLFQYDLVGRLLEETDGDGHALADYIYLDGRPIAVLSPATGELYFIHADRLGTPQAMTDASQAVVWAASYEPFGKAVVRAASLAQSLRLPGQYFDAETGYHQNGFRTYDPSLGRYLESDPLGLAAGLNTYGYVRSNPLTRVDYSGLCDLSTALAITGKTANIMSADFGYAKEATQLASVLAQLGASPSLIASADTLADYFENLGWAAAEDLNQDENAIDNALTTGEWQSLATPPPNPLLSAGAAFFAPVAAILQRIGLNRLKASVERQFGIQFAKGLTREGALTAVRALVGAGKVGEGVLAGGEFAQAAGIAAYAGGTIEVGDLALIFLVFLA